jgi:hypothetical protein
VLITKFLKEKYYAANLYYDDVIDDVITIRGNRNFHLRFFVKRRVVIVFLGFSCVVLDRVREALGRVVGLGSKPNGFRSKPVSKPIIPLKPFWKSLR